ncbi:4-hydroxythreonine-4-phosphate dehydrogenase [Roseibium sp. RKSG952]|nr:4-hydroxythreonine-4-phosphate dehydrogenase [Roseibium sp. RKSG952]
MYHNKDTNRKTLAIVQGDPAGIGPELLIKLLNCDEVRKSANLVIIGDPAVFKLGEEQTGISINGVRHAPPDTAVEISAGEILHLDMHFAGIRDVRPSQATAIGGNSSIRGFHRALELSRDSTVDGVVFMPFNKECMHLAGSQFTDEIAYATDFFKLSTRPSEFNVVRGMWNGRVTSHVALRDVPNLLSIERIEQSIHLTNHTLKAAGFDNPRIVVAALNPHAGDGGLMGDEEAKYIRPAVRLAQEKNVNCVGPVPADTLWLKVREGAYDAVVSMYHDQGQIAIKLLGFDQGVSVLAGLPTIITTPAHGTAYDIAGQNKATVVPTVNAFLMCLNIASNRKMHDFLEGLR